MRPALLALAILASTLVSSTAGAQLFREPRYGVHLTLPPGLTPLPDDALGVPNAIAGFRARLGPDGGAPDGGAAADATVLLVHTGALLEPPAAPPTGEARWKDFMFPVAHSGDRLAVTVPLKPEAIEVSVRAADEPAARALLQRVLDGLDGPTNWVTARERASRVGFAVTYVIAGALAILLVGLGLWRGRRRRR